MTLPVPKKVISLEQASTLTTSLKKDGKKIAFTNGSFDILHSGHVDYLIKAKQLGDILILGLNSDSSVKSYKGDKRPINAETDRAYVLAALEAIDYIIIFTESTPEHLIEVLQPDIHVKGGDYTIDTLPEAKIIQAYGGKIELVPFVPGKSTSTIIEKICDVYQ
jgi:D-glycero-beta-D-manno-heptose 1-phosphate adenylyltransferase